MRTYEYQARAILALANSSDLAPVSTTVAKMAGLLALPLEPLEPTHLLEGRKVFPSTALEVFFDVYRGYLGCGNPSARLLDAFADCSLLIRLGCQHLAKESSWRIDGTHLDTAEGFSEFVKSLGELLEGDTDVLEQVLEHGELEEFAEICLHNYWVEYLHTS